MKTKYIINFGTIAGFFASAITTATALPFDSFFLFVADAAGFVVSAYLFLTYFKA